MIKVIIKRVYKGIIYEISMDYHDLLTTDRLAPIIENVEKFIDTIAQKWQRIDRVEKLRKELEVKKT